MSILRQYDYIDTPIACFGETLIEAREAAVNKCTELNSRGNIAMLDDQGFKLRDCYYDDAGNKIDKKLYAWNVQVKRVNYK